MSPFWSIYGTILLAYLAVGLILTSVLPYDDKRHEKGMNYILVALIMLVSFGFFTGLNALWGWHLIPWFDF